MIIPFVLSKQTPEARDAGLEMGYKKCGGRYATYSGCYPILRGFSYYLCAIHTNYLFFSYSYLGIGHMISMVCAFKTGEIQIAMENINLCVYVYLQGVGVSIAIFGRRHLNDIFRTLGTKMNDYSRPTTPNEEDIFDDKNCDRLLFINFATLSGMSVFLFGIWPIWRTFSYGKLSTENDITPESYPFNMNLPLKLPLPYKTDTFLPYIISFVLEFLSAHAISLTIVCYQNLFLGINIQMWNQLRLLRASLDDLHSRAVYLFKSRGLTDQTRERKAFQKCLKDCLIENIRHHTQIMKLHFKVEAFFNPFLLINFLLNSVLVFLALYQIYQVKTSDESWLVKVAAILTLVIAAVAQASIYCLCGQRTTSLSEDLEFAFYNCRWDEYSVDFRKTLLTTIVSAQRPLGYSGCSLLPANIETLVNILKTSFTYLNFMQVAME